MTRYAKYATTVIGAHSVPDWYEALDRLVSVGQLSMAALADAQYRAGDYKAAVTDLQKSLELPNGNGAEVHFLLAMAHHKLGDAEAACAAYALALQWLDQNQLNLEKDKKLVERLLRVRTEVDKTLQSR